MEKIKSYIYKIILVMVFLLVVCSTYFSVFNIYQAHANLTPIVIGIGVLAMTLIFIALRNIIRNMSEHTSNIVAAVMCILFFILMCVFAIFLNTVPSSDIAYLRNEGQLMLQNGGVFESEDYFSRYSYQTPVAILVYFIYKIGMVFGFTNVSTFATIVNALFIAITAGFTYLIVKKIKNHNFALLTLIFFIINPIFYLYAPYYYSDTLCMPFAAVAMYLFVTGTKNNSRVCSILSLIISGSLIAIGTKIRAVVAIILVGFIISIWVKNKISKTMIYNISSLCIGFIIGWIICSIIAIPFRTPNIESCKLPPTYWVMMGLNTESDGKYIAQDRAYTETEEAYNDKVKLTVNEIKKRICDMGGSDFIKFEVNKIAVNWSNGDYDYVQKLTNVEKPNVLYDYTVGNKKIFVLYYAQICKVFTLLLVTAAGAREIYRKKIDKYNSFIFISILGAYLFYLMWEVAPRYSLTFLPWMYILFGQGLEVIISIINAKKISLDSKTINLTCFKKVIVVTTIVSSIMLMILNYNKYAVKKDEYSDVVAIQYRKNTEQAISDRTFEQSFVVSSNFNSISLKFIKEDDVKKETHYRFTLLDGNGNNIYEKVFSSKSIKDNKYKTFSFKEVKVSKGEEYKIRVTSEDANKSNSLKILMFSMPKCDLYPLGNLKIDNVESGDIVFRVQNDNTRCYMSKSVYVIMCAMVLVVEALASYGILKNNIKED